MNRNIWIVAGIGVLILGIVNVVLGMNLVPTKAIAEQRGTVAGWWLIWTVIVLTVMCSVALGAYLLAAGLGKVPDTAD
jgi:hypothetical protein